MAWDGGSLSVRRGGTTSVLSSVRVKNRDLSASLEDYLEAIYQQCEQKSFAHANKIAEHLGVGKSSVSWALNQLSEKGLVNYAPYEAVTLTEKGMAAAGAIARRHQNIKDFLTDVLAINEEVAEENACRLEHVIDRGVLRRMKQFMDFLRRCPRLGEDWMKGFGYFCKQGSHLDKCEQCLADCAAQAKEVSATHPPDPESQLADVPKRTKPRDQLTVQHLREILEESGRSFSRAQETIVKTFMQTEKHLTIKDLYDRTHKSDSDVTPGLIGETMRLLCEHKIARSLRFRDEIVYEHLHPESHHDHLFCVKCGAIVEFFDPRIETLQVETARRADFRLLQHSLNIYGVCHDCIKRESKTRPLTECLSGECVQIAQIVADDETTKRIGEMGLRSEMIVEVLSNDCCGGNVIVLAGGTRLMLDPGTAEGIKATGGRMVMPEMGPGWGRGRRGRHRHAPDRRK